MKKVLNLAKLLIVVSIFTLGSVATFATMPTPSIDLDMVIHLDGSSSGGIDNNGDPIQNTNSSTNKYTWVNLANPNMNATFTSNNNLTYGGWINNSFTFYNNIVLGGAFPANNVHPATISNCINPQNFYIKFRARFSTMVPSGATIVRAYDSNKGIHISLLRTTYIDSYTRLIITIDNNSYNYALLEGNDSMVRDYVVSVTGTTLKVYAEDLVDDIVTISQPYSKNPNITEMTIGGFHSTIGIHDQLVLEELIAYTKF